MAVVETEEHGQVLIVRMNRPERLNALNAELRTALAETWTQFRHDDRFEVAIFTGSGRGFCAGEDMKEVLQRGAPGGARPAIEDPFMTGALEKPVIAAVNGFAMGGGFMLVERTDLRVAAKGAVFEVSEAKRWLLGGYNHGHIANLPYPIAMEMALGFRFTAERFYEVGFLNRLVEPDQLMPTALGMAEHMLTLPPASRVNTVHMMRQMRPAPGAELQRLAAALHEHGDKSDLHGIARRLRRKAPPQLQGLERPAGPLPPADARFGQVIAALPLRTLPSPGLTRGSRGRAGWGMGQGLGPADKGWAKQCQAHARPRRQGVRGIPPLPAGGDGGREPGYPGPPAQNRTCGFPASGSHLG